MTTHRRPPAPPTRLALPARALVVALLAAGGVAAPVVPLAPLHAASAAPRPVTPEAQVLAVPERGTAPSAAPATPSPPTRSPEVPGALGAPGAPDASEEAETATTGAVATDDFRMLSVSWSPEAATAAGIEAASAAQVEVRVRTEDGWSGWEDLPVEDAGPDPGTAEARGAARDAVVATEPLWVGDGADGVDVRVTGEGVAASDDVEVTLIEPRTAPADREVAGVGGRAAAAPAATPAATASAAAAGVPSITSRAQWGADESLRTDRCAEVSYTGTPRVAFVHHTAGTNDYSPAESAAIVRGIYYHHTQVQGWCDVGYNVLVDKYGQVFEGRYGGLDKAVLGAHAAGFNANSFGVSVLGNYSEARPSAAVTTALARVIAWKLGLSQTDPLGSATLVSAGKSGTSRYEGGTAVTLPVITGHRAVGLTECPGTHLFAALPALRTEVAALMREKWWELRDTASAGSADRQVYYGSPGDVALACDWDGDGTAGIAVYAAGTWYLRGPASSGAAGLVVRYGSGAMLPVCGDWDGDGKDSIGVYEPATGLWWLRNSTTGGPPDLRFQYGFRGAVPVVGDWDGVGRDGIGVYEPASGRWFLRGTPTAGPAGAVFGYGFAATTPVTGDWDGDGDDSVGVYAAGEWYLRESITPGQPHRRFSYGLRSDTALVGTWDGERTGIAVTRSWP